MVMYILVPSKTDNASDKAKKFLEIRRQMQKGNIQSPPQEEQKRGNPGQTTSTKNDR